jgi:hypothetical protein
VYGGKEKTAVPSDSRETLEKRPSERTNRPGGSSESQIRSIKGTGELQKQAIDTSLTKAEKNRIVEKTGETAIRQKFYRMDYDHVFRLQYDGVHGKDFGVLKDDEFGNPVEGGVVEAKTLSGHAPGPSRFKDQVDPIYDRHALEKARDAGVRGADELYRLAKANKVKSFGATYGVADKGQGPRIYEMDRKKGSQAQQVT